MFVAQMENEWVIRCVDSAIVMILMENFQELQMFNDHTENEWELPCVNSRFVMTSMENLTYFRMFNGQIGTERAS
jgi:hypothetical protein